MPETPPEMKSSPPSYHDLHITTAKIPRTSIFDLPYALEVTCTRTRGWALWDMDHRQPPIRSQSGALGRLQITGASVRGLLLAEEYGGPGMGLRLDVAGHVIVDSLTRDEPDEADTSKDEAGAH